MEQKFKKIVAEFKKQHNIEESFFNEEWNLYSFNYTYTFNKQIKYCSFDVSLIRDKMFSTEVLSIVKENRKQFSSLEELNRNYERFLSFVGNNEDLKICKKEWV